MVFVIPRQEVTYIGTTDTAYKGDKDKVLANATDVSYLLQAVNHMFPEVHLTKKDVVSSWAGLRPLIHEDGKSASEMSRKDEIFESNTGLISIAGGKLTGYRKMAQRVMDLVAKRYQSATHKELPKCKTRQISLAGGPWTSAAEIPGYISKLHQSAEPKGLTLGQCRYLVYNYGKESEEIIQSIDISIEDRETALACAEVAWCIQHELVIHPLDFYNRRSGRLYFRIHTIKPSLEPVLDQMQKLLRWTDQEKTAYRTQVLEAVKEVSVFE